MVLKFLLGLFGLIALGLIVANILAARHDARALAAHPAPGQIIDVDGQKVHAVVEGTGPDLVLIHGSSGSTRDFTFGMLDALKDRYRVIIFDRPGLGYSDPLPGGGSIVEQAQVLQQAAAALGADAPLVLGQSYGGAVALAWAVHLPDTLSGLIPLASPSQRWEGGLDPLYKLNSSAIAPYTSIPLITAFVPEGYVRGQVQGVFDPQDMPEGFDDHINIDLLLRQGPQRANALQRATLKEEISALQTRYGEITVPTELIHGTADTIVPLSIHAEPLAEQIPDAVLTRLDGIGHMPQHVALEATVAGIDRVAARAGLR